MLEYEFFGEIACDVCGYMGVYDCAGDYLCSFCINEELLMEDADEEEEGNC
jgi:hypothetical protein